MGTPEISVVVPTYERIGALEECLRAMALQTIAPSKFEVIVCDDGSRQPIAESLAPTLDALGGQIRVQILRQENRGPAAARNRGAEAALGRFLAFTDDDCRPEHDWLERLLHHFARRPHSLLGGGLRVTTGSDRYARATQAIMDFIYAEQEKRNDLRVFSTSNLALPAEGFRQMGGFSTSFTQPAGEDYDLCANWYRGGGATVYVPDAMVAHDHALTLGRYWLQHFTYGRGLLRVRQRLSKTGVPMHRGSFPGIFHLRLIASPIVRDGPRGASCALLVALAQAATSAGALAELTVRTSSTRTTRAAGAA